MRRHLKVLEVVARDSDLLVTFRWLNYPFHVIYPLDPREVMLQGGELRWEEESPEFWADEALEQLGWMLEWLDPIRSRRRAVGDAVEIIAHELPEDRFYASHDSFSEVPEDWDFVSHGGGPGKPPPIVAATRADGSLVGWHLARMEHRYPLPYLGQVATRWESAGVASLYFLEVADDMPAILPLVLVSSAMQFAASRGAHTVTSQIDSRSLQLLGFRSVDGVWQTDTRFVDVDNDALDALARGSKWKYPLALKKAIKRASKATYLAG